MVMWKKIKEFFLGKSNEPASATALDEFVIATPKELESVTVSKELSPITPVDQTVEKKKPGKTPGEKKQTEKPKKSNTAKKKNKLPKSDSKKSVS